MKLASLLEHHAKSATAGELPSLNRVFGDGFLITNNSIYRAVRSLADRAGYQFSREQNDAYRVLPLSQLEEILRSKKIPYFDNVTVLEDLEKRIPRATVWGDISDNLKGNSVFHEGAHAAARAASLSSGGADVSSRPELRALVMLLEESYANAVELLSIVDAEDQVHRIFLELNSYVYMLNDRVHLRNAETLLGRSTLLRFLVLCYLYANFLREFSDSRGGSFDQVLDLLASLSPESKTKLADAKTRRSLRQLSKVAFELNPRFREVTTRFYLRLSGVAFDVTGSRDFDFMAELSTSKSARAWFMSSLFDLA